MQSPLRQRSQADGLVWSSPVDGRHVIAAGRSEHYEYLGYLTMEVSVLLRLQRAIRGHCLPPRVGADAPSPEWPQGQFVQPAPLRWRTRK